MQPLVDKVLHHRVAARQQKGDLAVLQRLVGVDGAQARLLALHHQRLGRLGDEDVLPAGQDFVKDGQVLGVDRQLGLLVA